MEFVLVMTASVDPNGMTGLSSPESLKNREKQYVDTLNFYTKHDSIRKILFAENSNYDLKRIESQLNDASKVVWLSMDLNKYPREYGKGYGEFLIMDNAVDYVRNTLHENLIVKVTGRFPIRNIDTMIREFSMRKNLGLAIDIVRNPVYRWMGIAGKGGDARTIIYAISCDFYMRNCHGRYRREHAQYTGAESFMYQVWLENKNLTGGGGGYISQIHTRTSSIWIRRG